MQPASGIGACWNRAIDRPRNKSAYGERDLAKLAAAHAYGIALHHPFVDANKRAALMRLMAFSRRNGVAFSPSDADVTAAMIALAAGEVDEDCLGRWIRDNRPV